MLELDFDYSEDELNAMRASLRMDELLRKEEAEAEEADAEEEAAEEGDDEDASSSGSSSGSDSESDSPSFTLQKLFFAKAPSDGDRSAPLAETGVLASTRADQLTASVDKNGGITVEWLFISSAEQEAVVVGAICVPASLNTPSLHTATDASLSTAAMLTLSLSSPLGEGCFFAQDMNEEANEFVQVNDWSRDGVASRADALVILGDSSELLPLVAHLSKRFPSLAHLVPKEEAASAHAHEAAAPTTVSAYREPNTLDGFASDDDKDDDDKDGDKDEQDGLGVALEPLPVTLEELASNLTLLQVSPHDDQGETLPGLDDLIDALADLPLNDDEM